MKVAFFIITLLGLPVMAQQYKAPKLNDLSWKNQGVNSYYEKTQKWGSDYQLKDMKYPTDADENEETTLRKPSSGEESAKPKFWDFRAVK